MTGTVEVQPLSVLPLAQLLPALDETTVFTSCASPGVGFRVVTV